MENENRFCPDCGTENEPKYEYCKNCGALLLDPELLQQPVKQQAFVEQPYVQQPNMQQSYIQQNIPQQPYANVSPYRTPEGYVPQSNTVYNEQANFAYEENFVNKQEEINNIQFFGAVTVEEAEVFVGKNAPKIISKFKKIEYNNRKVTWCWSIAILSYILGPLGAALWFFHRKMQKLAWLFMAAAIVMVSAQTVFTLAVETIDFSSVEAPISEITSASGLEEYMESYMDILGSSIDEDDVKGSLFTMLFDFFNSSVNIATTAICGMFAFYWYKKHTESEILKFRSSGVDMRYYQIGLMTKGGTSGGLIVLGVALYIITAIVTGIAAYLLMY